MNVRSMRLAARLLASSCDGDVDGDEDLLLSDELDAACQLLDYETAYAVRTAALHGNAALRRALVLDLTLRALRLEQDGAITGPLHGLLPTAAQFSVVAREREYLLRTALANAVQQHWEDEA